jgi:hypothetical protein
VASIDQFLRRNQDFAATGAREGPSVIARHQVYVITCMDPRTDLSAFLELDLGGPPHRTRGRSRAAWPAALGDGRIVKRNQRVSERSFQLRRHRLTTTGPPPRRAEAMAGREAALPPGSSRAEILRSLT